MYFKCTHGNVLEAHFSCMSQQGEPNSKHAFLFTLTSAVNQIFNLMMFGPEITQMQMKYVHHKIGCQTK